MNLVVVDAEANGPIPGEYSMLGFGAVVAEPSLRKTFYGPVRPITERYLEEALRVSGFRHEEHLCFDAHHHRDGGVRSMACHRDERAGRLRRDNLDLHRPVIDFRILA